MYVQNKVENHSKLFHILLIVLPVVVAILTLGLGRYNINPKEVIEIIVARISGRQMDTNGIGQNIVLNLRLPRIIMAIVVGGGLSVAGVAMQSIFSNPLATPDTIGVGSGASFGAVIGILLTDNIYIIQLLAFIMGLVAMYITYSFSKINKGNRIIMIVLAGMVVTSFFGALVSFLKTVADTDTQLPSIVYWLMGSMASSSFKSLISGVPFIIVGTIVIFLSRWKMNILLLSEDEARSMGVNVNRMRLMIIGSSALITASAVSMCGQVGWVGLLIPHLSRMIIGSDNTYVVPLSISFGGVFMLVVDTLARTVSPTEIPLSVITAIIGVPFFAYLIKKTGGIWQ